MSSDRAKHWAWKQAELSGSQLLLLLAMADHVGEELVCYARLSTLGEMARISERTVQRQLAELVELGKIEVLKERPGRTTLYRICIPDDFGRVQRTPDKMTGVRPSEALQASNGAGSSGTDDKMTGVTDTPPTECQGPPSNCQGTHDKMSPDSSLDPSLRKPSQTRAGARAGPASSPARAHGSEPNLDLAALNRSAAELGLKAHYPGESDAAFLRRVREAEGKDLVLNNSARNLGIPTRLESETLAEFERRVDRAHGERLRAQIESKAAQRAARATA